PHREIKGPLGTAQLPLPHYLTLTLDTPDASSLAGTAAAPNAATPPIATTKATVSIADPKVRKQREMWGTTRALLAQHILGVTEGHTAILRLNGVGYRALMEQDNKVVSLKVGFSHPVELPVPEGVKAST